MKKAIEANSDGLYGFKKMFMWSKNSMRDPKWFLRMVFDKSR